MPRAGTWLEMNHKLDLKPRQTELNRKQIIKRVQSRTASAGSVSLAESQNVATLRLEPLPPWLAPLRRTPFTTLRLPVLDAAVKMICASTLALAQVRYSRHSAAIQGERFAKVEDT